MKPSWYPKFKPSFAGMAAGLAALVSSFLTGCKTPPSPPSPPAAEGAAAVGIGIDVANTAQNSAKLLPPSPSTASTPRAYRQDAAKHLYAHNADRISHGRLPPQLFAVGVLNTDIDRHGNVTGLHWLRAPRHAPKVMAEIERTVRAAAPYPTPRRMGKVTYTDTWLWDSSGRFQLDTLTEGQN
jgi:protein TonB